MHKNIFGFNQKPRSSEHPERLQIERDLGFLAAQVEATCWIALVTSRGLLQGTFPAQPGIDTDRITAMSAALLSLGERITSELNDGKLQYSLLAGDEGATLLLLLSPDYVLTVGLNRETFTPLIFERLREALNPLLKTLQITNLPWL
jgi:predicted regulator of Ras-like GTPase activity (Roadblock/LC7/MglB family)